MTAASTTRDVTTGVEELLTLALSIPSPSGAEAALVAALTEELRARGFTAHVDEVGNMIGEIGPPDGPEIMLLGHVDTVPGDIPVRREGDLLHGRGSVDAKTPLVTMILAAARAAHHPSLPARVTVVGVVEEETPQSRGAVHIARSRPAPAALVVGEPSGWSDVVIGYKGKLDLRYRVSCAPTHSSMPDPKAADLMADVWAVIVAELGGHDHGRFDLPGVTLLRCRGDMEHAELEVDVRLPPGFDVDDYVARVRSRVSEGALDVVHCVDAVRATRSNPVVRALDTGIRQHGERPGHKVKTGTSDMNILARHWRVPMATYGPGDSKLDHADNEHVDLRDVERGVEVLTAALTDLTECLSSAAAASGEKASIR